VERLTDTLAASLRDRVVTGAPVGSLADVAEGGDVAATVLAVPAFEAARLVEAVAATASDGLRLIPYASTGVVFLVFGEGTQALLPEGTGFVVPPRQGAHDGVHLDQQQVARPGVRLAGGGPLLHGRRRRRRRAGRERRRARRRVRPPSRRRARPPRSARVVVGRPLDACDAAVRGRACGTRRCDPGSLPAGIFVVGSAYDGVGIPDCVRAAGETAEKVLAHLDHATIEKETGSMSDTTDHTDTIYASYPAFRARDGFRDLSADGLSDVVQEVENLYKSFDGRVEVRGTYSTVGFRHDTDLLLWLVATAPEDLQAFLAELPSHAGGTAHRPRVDVHGCGQAGGVHRRSPARVRQGRSAQDVRVRLSVRAHARVVPAAARGAGALLAEHGIVGREFPDVLANTTSAFGLGDWEWILAFEADRADMLVDCIRRLRDAKARLYTKEEIPFVTGIRKSVADAFADLA
jgi:chlorite dismutase